MAYTLDHRVVSRDEWVAERMKLLAHEKELTRLGDQIARERQTLPWVRIDKTYIFDTPAGAPLHARSGLGGGLQEYMADHTDGATVHLAQRDVTFIAVSRAPLSEIERFRHRMGWKFSWVSAYGNDFNGDFHVSFTADEMANGKADYNFRKCSAPAPSGKMTQARSSIPTRPTAAAWR
jgi:predicted dithiol-disulfide oxidoreductase (DUF899 family)